jgi:hypothetical protein
VNPIGSVLTVTKYLFYDIRLTSLSRLASYDFLQKTIIKLSEKAYYYFKRPLQYFLEYLKIQQEEYLAEKEEKVTIKYLETENGVKFARKLEEISQLGINTYSLVLIWSGFKSLAKLCQRISQQSPLVVNYHCDSSKEDKSKKFMSEQAQLWEERAIEVKDFINKYGWCAKNKTFTSFIKLTVTLEKEEEY